jgi:hypothetical protein
MGKSSLMVRTAKRLEAEGVRTAMVDLTQIGTRFGAEEWYLSLISQSHGQLKLTVDYKAWWEARSGLSPVQRFSDFLRQVVLEEILGKVVIFVDEIETTLKLDLSDDFFAAIRAAYNARASDIAYERLAFVLLGVAVPDDLIHDPHRTPFNIGQRIDLADFTWEQALPLANGLGADQVINRKLLERIMHWTGGHPYLTQRGCYLATKAEVQVLDEKGVDQLIRDAFLSRLGRDELNLATVRKQILEDGRAVDLLELYLLILSQEVAVPDNDQSTITIALKLTGVVKANDQGFLQVRNRIYADVFGRTWARSAYIHTTSQKQIRLEQLFAEAKTLFQRKEYQLCLRKLKILRELAPYFPVGDLEHQALKEQEDLELASLYKQAILALDKGAYITALENLELIHKRRPNYPDPGAVVERAHLAQARRMERLPAIPQDLLRFIREGQCILFVGSGLSREAGLPDRVDLAKSLRSKIDDERFQPEADAPLSEVAQAYEASRSYSRAELVRAIRDALTVPAGQSFDVSTVRLIAHIPYLNRRIITTNWDSLLESVIRDTARVSPAIIVKDIDMGKVSATEYSIYKIQGCLDEPETMVLTELDYRRMYVELFQPHSLYMAHIRALLTGNVVIYVGYSLQDPDSHELLTQIQSALVDMMTGQYQGCPQYAIIPRLGMPEHEYMRMQREWKKKHVQVIDCTARAFFEEVYQQTSGFKDRGRELDLLMGLGSWYPYVEVVGNIGSGKTRLLQEIGVRYQHELRWSNLVYLDMAHTDDPVKSIAQILGRKLETLAEIRTFAASNRLLILLDSMDRAEPDKLEALCREFIPQAIEPRQRISSLIIWATRYSISPYLPLSVKSHLLSFSLTMFNEYTTAELVQEYIEVMVGKHFDDVEAEEFTQEILRLTGGNPGLIMETLRVLKQEPEVRFSIAYLRSREGNEDILRALMSIVNKVLPQDPALCEALQNILCVLRGIHLDVLDYLVHMGALALGSRSAEDYATALWNTHLFDTTGYPLYWVDPVIRHVLNQILEIHDPYKFISANSICLSYFEQAVRLSTEDVQRVYLKEWLYHRATELLVQNLDHNSRFQALHDNLKTICLKSNSPVNPAIGMADEIRNDKELASLLTECLGERFFDLIAAIETLPVQPY